MINSKIDATTEWEQLLIDRLNECSEDSTLCKRCSVQNDCIEWWDSLVAKEKLDKHQRYYALLRKFELLIRLRRIR
ncbi:hypothetical protein LCGC14_1145880 [marine sediment metagenome]|uniref:Uncharacterized protein n=1 Tax=marine sediment metagenome TaxID=412755 RepID=A0A0F9LWV4_9ZZZZ